MISVIIPLYNKEKSIAKTISSVLCQTFVKFELVIVNDGSTDNSLDVVKSFSDDRIRIVEKKNGGVSSARNFGIKNSKYDYLVFLDGDDLWNPVHLEEFIKMIDFNPEVKFYATKFTKEREKFNLQNESVEIKVIKNFYLKESYATTILSSSSFGFKKAILQKLDYWYNETLKYGEDVDFWYRILQGESLVYSEKITVLYNIESENRSDNVLPIEYRFHKFDFSNKTSEEKKYLGKLVALVMIDYVYFKSYRVSFQIFFKYIKQSKYILRYFFLLLNKKIRKL